MMRWILIGSLALIAVLGTLLLMRGAFVPVPAAPAGYLYGKDPIPDGPLHVLALGTSLTARGPWPDELEMALKTSRPGSRVEVLARPGANSRWGEAALARRLAVAPVPDVVLIEFSANDASLAHGMSRKAAREGHQRIVSLVRGAGAVPILLVPSPASGRQWLERPGLAAYQQDYRRTAEVAVVDTIGLWQGMPDGEAARLMPDGLHPTAEAWRQTLLPMLIPALSPQPLSPGP